MEQRTTKPDGKAKESRLTNFGGSKNRLTGNGRVQNEGGYKKEHLLKKTMEEREVMKEEKTRETPTPLGSEDLGWMDEDELRQSQKEDANENL